MRRNREVGSSATDTAKQDRLECLGFCIITCEKIDSKRNGP